jgi:hypothetical protein
MRDDMLIQRTSDSRRLKIDYERAVGYPLFSLGKERNNTERQDSGRRPLKLIEEQVQQNILRGPLAFLLAVNVDRLRAPVSPR